MTPEQIAELEKRIETKFYKGTPKQNFTIIFIGDKPKKSLAKKQAEYSALLHKRSKDPLWKQAFDEYNTANPDNQYHMGCSPCFAKVLFWHKKTLENKES